jgi:hypothetical protein
MARRPPSQQLVGLGSLSAAIGEVIFLLGD